MHGPPSQHIQGIYNQSHFHRLLFLLDPWHYYYSWRVDAVGLSASCFARLRGHMSTFSILCIVSMRILKNRKGLSNFTTQRYIELQFLIARLVVESSSLTGVCSSFPDTFCCILLAFFCQEGYWFEVQLMGFRAWALLVVGERPAEGSVSLGQCCGWNLRFNPFSASLLWCLICILLSVLGGSQI